MSNGNAVPTSYAPPIEKEPDRTLAGRWATADRID